MGPSRVNGSRRWTMKRMKVWWVFLAIGWLASASLAGVPASDPTLRAADEALRRGAFAEAAKLASQLLRDNPKDFRVLFLRGQAYDGAKDYSRALADYTAGLQL